MARRARKGVEPTQILIIVGVLLALGGIAFVMANRTSDKFADQTPLPVDEYMRNANSLSGNSYKLSGTVAEKLRFTADNGQFIRIELEDGNDIVDLAVYVPVEFYGTNIDRGDILTAKVEVKKGGILSIQEIQ